MELGHLAPCKVYMIESIKIQHLSLKGLGLLVLIYTFKAITHYW